MITCFVVGSKGKLTFKGHSACDIVYAFEDLIELNSLEYE